MYHQYEHHKPSKPHHPGHHHGGYKPPHGGQNYLDNPPVYQTPLEKLADEVAQNKADIEGNKQAIALLQATQSRLVYDYFYVNELKLTLIGEE